VDRLGDTHLLNRGPGTVTASCDDFSNRVASWRLLGPERVGIRCPVFTLTETLSIGAVLLVVAASVPAPRKPGVFWGWLVCLVALAAGSLAVHNYVQRSGYAPKSPPSARAKFVRKTLPKLKAKNVLWLDGGSYPANGVSSAVLERELGKLGYDVDVMNLSMGASNHLEREALYRRLTPVFDEHRQGRKKRQRWVYLAEVQHQYDDRPLAQFGDNKESARAYDYMTPAVVWDAFQAIGSAHTRVEPPRWTQLLDVLRHGLVFAFNAGVTSRVVAPKKIRALPGDVRRNTPRRMRYRGLSKVIAEAKRPHRASVPPWLFDVRERRELEIWGDHIQKWLYYSVPNTKAGYLRHSTNFCAATPRPCINPADVDLLQRLDARRNWINSGHLSIRGAKIYSKWLAKKIHESGALAH
jgi:hypothetical protein